MKLAFIIIPHETKLGNMTVLLKKTIKMFYNEFNGCSHYPIQGIWKGHLDGLLCEKIEVAMNLVDGQKFVNIANDVAVRAGVEKLMIQHPNGNILFINGKVL